MADKVTQTLFWYDLETTGVNPRDDRVMQFAGQRTDMQLRPVGEPVNVLIKLSDDILPSPDAILVTGITPQQTIADGMTELEFLRFFHEEVVTPDTIFVGFNSVRFDDEFMRYLHYRNFYDAYEWEWQDGRSRWDMLDVIRMTRALRPDGINWPFTDGKPGNRLEQLTAANGIVHEGAHDALADVEALIALAKLVQTKQPKLFAWLLEYRDKRKVATLVQTGEPFVYSSGKYPAETEKTTVAIQLAPHPKKQGALVYDLRHDPTEFLAMTPEQLAARWRWTRDEDAPPRLPVKTMQFNRCPAVAPYSVLDKDSQKRLQLSPKQLKDNQVKLAADETFVERVLAALELLDADQERYQATRQSSVDTQLYDGFFSPADKTKMAVVRAAAPDELSEVGRELTDKRLQNLLPLFKARNYRSQLTTEEREAWEAHRHHTLMDGGTESRLARFMHRLSQLAAETEGDANKRYLLEELQLYAESIMPALDVE